MITLSFLNGPRAGEIISLPEGKWTLGRAPDNAVVIPDPSVSARHAELLVNSGKVIVRELSARNGTFVQGLRVEAQSPVKSGQGVRFGAVELRVLCSVAEDHGDATSGTAPSASQQPGLPPLPARVQELANNTSTIADPPPVKATVPQTPRTPTDPPESMAQAGNSSAMRQRLRGWSVGLGTAILLLTLWLLRRSGWL